MSFLGLLRQLGARHPELPGIGRATRPQDEPFRIGQRASLAFAPREIAQVELAKEEEALHIEVYGLGMLGPNGPLPLHMTEIVRARSQGNQDTTTADFLNMFHHRALTQFYQAWARAQATAGLDRASDEVFSRYVCWLSGNDPEEIKQGPLPTHARLAASAHFVCQARNPDGIAATLSHFFGVHVRLQEFVVHWVPLDPADVCRLGRPGPASVMGHGALLGTVVPDRQHKFRLELGPLSLEQYLNFTPGGRDLPILIEWMRAFVGYGLAWELALLVDAASSAAPVLGGPGQLGWSTWLGAPPGRQTITGMVFEPERYARH